MKIIKSSFFIISRAPSAHSNNKQQPKEKEEEEEEEKEKLKISYYEIK